MFKWLDTAYTDARLRSLADGRHAFLSVLRGRSAVRCTMSRSSRSRCRPSPRSNERQAFLLFRTEATQRLQSCCRLHRQRAGRFHKASRKCFQFSMCPNWAIRLVVLLIIIGLPDRADHRMGIRSDAARESSARKRPMLPRRTASGVIVDLCCRRSVPSLSIGLFFLGRYTAVSRSDFGESDGPAVHPFPAKSIAVLPLVNESGDPKDEYFSDGLSEELIAALAQIRGLKVIGRSSSFRFKDRKEDREHW